MSLQCHRSAIAIAFQLISFLSSEPEPKTAVEVVNLNHETPSSSITITTNSIRNTTNRTTTYKPPIHPPQRPPKQSPPLLSSPTNYPPPHSSRLLLQRLPLPLHVPPLPHPLPQPSNLRPAPPPLRQRRLTSPRRQLTLRRVSRNPNRNLPPGPQRPSLQLRLRRQHRRARLLAPTRRCHRAR